MDHRNVRLPKFLQLEVSGQCNLRCQMCPIQFRLDGPPHGPPAFMKFALFERLLAQFPDLERLQLQGLGEPMMHPRFFDMVSLATARGIEVSTNTNVTYLNARRAQLCVTSGLSELHVSIDGATPQTFERIRVRAHFEQVITNLEGLVETKRRLGRNSPTLRLVVVAMRQNLPELADLVRLAHRLSIESVFVQHLCHDFGEQTLPPHYRPMRDFVESETLLNVAPSEIERAFTTAIAVAQDSVSNSGSRVSNPSPIRPKHQARNAVIGHGVVPTSAIKALRCLAAWSPLPTGSVWEIWPAIAFRPSGTANPTWHFEKRSARINRPLCADHARSTPVRSDGVDPLLK